MEGKRGDHAGRKGGDKTQRGGRCPRSVGDYSHHDKKNNASGKEGKRGGGRMPAAGLLAKGGEKDDSLTHMSKTVPLQWGKKRINNNKRKGGRREGPFSLVREKRAWERTACQAEVAGREGLIIILLFLKKRSSLMRRGEEKEETGASASVFGGSLKSFSMELLINTTIDRQGGGPEGGTTLPRGKRKNTKGALLRSRGKDSAFRIKSIQKNHACRRFKKNHPS